MTTKINEKTTLQVMRLLEENPDMTQRELAHALGVSVGGVNYCLNALMEKGWVKMKNFAQSKNKFGYIYVLTPRGVGERAALAQRFLARKMAEYEALREEIERLRLELRPGAPKPSMASGASESSEALEASETQKASGLVRTRQGVKPIKSIKADGLESDHSSQSSSSSSRVALGVKA